MLVKRLSVEHADEIHKIDVSCFSKPWSVDTVEAVLRSDGACVLGAFEEDRLIGYTSLEWVLDEGSLTNLAVLPECRRQGVAKTLAEELLVCAQSINLQFVTLEVRASNIPAISLYRKLRFAEVGRRPGYYSAPKEDALLMTCFFDRDKE